MPKDMCKIILNDNTKSESYRVSEQLFINLKSFLAPYRSNPVQPKRIKCIETGDCFNSPKNASDWLLTQGVTTTYTSVARIKNACKNKKIAFGYHWTFLEQ